MRTIDSDIDRAFQLAAECERQSDECFARGDVLNGSKHFRYALLAWSFAEELRRRNRLLRFDFDH